MNPVRAAAWEQLKDVPGAFLRCDRGEGLYVTNAPARTERLIDWKAAGFAARNEGKLTFLVPEEIWIERFVGWIRGLVGAAYLTEMLSNACMGGAEEADMRLWIEGIKRLDMHADAMGYERLVRQRAAVCLREKKGGGTLRACALIADLMREGGIRDED